ncbi:PepSY-associated TM helix domain-containing protein [Idiomarina xiamenensis]|uniref:Iron-regulated membrane protein n=1 Tax=Idiomarina xiamenensis 10-D-4 TaxID=740709 RepID=K2KPQ0_9GAMM|nr:PepSY-associated TM helix domain-containing protein [Idiomarina xiamenensis]EKE84434.1 hypothetical protein A10D4_05182 [Idiomarina xiamenensis 10-D-4]
MSKRMWFKLHGWFSLPIWVLFCFICLTGTIAVFSHELTWLFNENARANNPDNLPTKNVAELVEVVEQAYPTADVSMVLTFEPYLVNAVMFSDSDKPIALAYINQYSGEIQEINEGMTFINFMRSLHSWLLFPWQNGYSIGYYLVSAMSFVMLGALVTGLVIYKRFWQSFTQPKVRTHQGQRTLLADLHRLGGVWSIWFLMIMSVTGLWYLVQAVIWHADIDLEGHPPVVAVSEMADANGEPVTAPVGFAQALATVKQRFPQFQPTYVLLPEHNRDMYHFYGAGDEIFYDQYSYNVAINPWTGAIADEKSPATMSPLVTATHVADPLHYGTIGGIWTKAIWFIFGLILTAMSITGFMMWAGRTYKAARAKQRVDVGSKASLQKREV